MTFKTVWHAIEYAMTPASGCESSSRVWLMAGGTARSSGGIPLTLPEKSGGGKGMILARLTLLPEWAYPLIASRVLPVSELSRQTAAMALAPYIREDVGGEISLPLLLMCLQSALSHWLDGKGRARPGDRQIAQCTGSALHASRLAMQRTRTALDRRIVQLEAILTERLGDLVKCEGSHEGSHEGSRMVRAN